MKIAPLAFALTFFLLPLKSAHAAPPVWETDFGDELTDLTTDDDSETEVMLSFPFPFEGTDYTSVWVGTNGGLQLEDRGNDGDIDYDYWKLLEDFYDDGGYPLILPFETDLDLSTTGTIHFKDFGDRAVFTWNEVGTDAEEGHLSTFQIQLFPDGRIYFSYNGILDGPDEDLVESLGEGIVVGISGSTGTDPGPVDLSNRNETDDDTVYEVWNDPDPPANSLFDLDMKTLVFEPKEGGGFISYLFESMTGSAIPDLLIGKTKRSLKGDGVRDRRRPSPRQTIVHNRTAFTTNTSSVALLLQNDGASEGTLKLRSSGDRFPRMKVSARASVGGNVTAAIQTGRFAPRIPAGGSVLVTYSLRTDRFYAGVLRDGDRDDTVTFRLSGRGSTDNAAMTNHYR